MLKKRMVMLSIGGTIKGSHAELDVITVEILPGENWRKITQMVDSFFALGSWYNGVSLTVIDRVMVFVKEHPRNFRRNLEEIPIDKFIPNPLDWSEGWHLTFFKQKKQVDLYGFFKEERIREAALGFLLDLSARNGRGLTSREISGGLSGMFSVIGKGGHLVGMSQVINQWCRKDFLRREETPFGKMYYVTRLSFQDNKK